MKRHAPNNHSCGNKGGLDVMLKLEQGIAEALLEVPIEQKACLSMCLKGPNVQLQPEGKNWHGVGLNDVQEIVEYLKQCGTKL